MISVGLRPEPPVRGMQGRVSRDETPQPVFVVLSIDVFTVVKNLGWLTPGFIAPDLVSRTP